MKRSARERLEALLNRNAAGGCWEFSGASPWNKYGHIRDDRDREPLTHATPTLPRESEGTARMTLRHQARSVRFALPPGHVSQDAQATTATGRVASVRSRVRGAQDVGCQC